MVITDQILSLIRDYGARSYPYSDVAMLIGKTKEERAYILDQFSDPDGEVVIAYKKGRIQHEDKIDEALEKAITSGSEYADEMAKALNFRKKNRQLDNLKEQLFGV